MRPKKVFTTALPIQFLIFALNILINKLYKSTLIKLCNPKVAIIRFFSNEIYAFILMIKI